jgi:hypothetical protein
MASASADEKGGFRSVKTVQNGTMAQ